MRIEIAFKRRRHTSEMKKVQQDKSAVDQDNLFAKHLDTNSFGFCHFTIVFEIYQFLQFSINVLNHIQTGLVAFSSFLYSLRSSSISDAMTDEFWDVKPN